MYIFLHCLQNIAYPQEIMQVTAGCQKITYIAILVEKLNLKGIHFSANIWLNIILNHTCDFINKKICISNLYDICSCLYNYY